MRALGDIIDPMVGAGRQALGFQVEGVLATPHDELVEADLAMICDLVRAIREAERNDPLPPAAVAQAA
jgi:hypothetical protein